MIISPSSVSCRQKMSVFALRILSLLHPIRSETLHKDEEWCAFRKPRIRMPGGAWRCRSPARTASARLHRARVPAGLPVAASYWVPALGNAPRPAPPRRPFPALRQRVGRRPREPRAARRGVAPRGLPRPPSPHPAPPRGSLNSRPTPRADPSGGRPRPALAGPRVRLHVREALEGERQRRSEVPTTPTRIPTTPGPRPGEGRTRGGAGTRAGEGACVTQSQCTSGRTAPGRTTTAASAAEGERRRRRPALSSAALPRPATPRPPRPRGRMKESMAYYTCRAKPPGPAGLRVRGRREGAEADAEGRG